MKIKDFRRGMIVRNKETGEEGVTVDDFPGMLSCNTEDEVSVVYYGTDFSEGTDYRELEILGEENPIIKDPFECGAGLGEHACIFCVFDGEFKCQRHSEMRLTLIMRSGSMNSKRQPTEQYPQCQLSEEQRQAFENEQTQQTA